MAKQESTVRDHLEWLGYVQPTGLVVSAHMLVSAGAILDKRDSQGQRLLRELVLPDHTGSVVEQEPRIDDFVAFTSRFLGWSWSPKGYSGTSEAPIPDELKLYLGDYDVVIAPNYAVRERDPNEGESAWQLLVVVVEDGQDLDAVYKTKQFEASPQSRMERLLRHTDVPAGLLTNGRIIRLISAPKGESSGWLDFRLTDLVETAGRPICNALRLLLGQPRLLALPRDKRLAALLRESRKHQNEVSGRLAEQVLHALYELLRGLQAANDASRGELLEDVLAEDPNVIYHALLTVLLRLVFLLYAEERGMLPQDEAFLKHYSVTGLHERLREEAALYPDTMNQRYGAWAQLLVLFRMIYDGAATPGFDLPARHGQLFDPKRFSFLEGGRSLEAGSSGDVPRISDDVVDQALESLLVLDGERLSYRALDVEQIGSVYETLMGFQLMTTVGRSVAIRAQARNGAPTVIDLDDLIGVKPTDRKKWLGERLDRKLTARVVRLIEEAGTIEGLVAALKDVIDERATPGVVPAGTLTLQPSDERRRSGSHYTPRELTEPIVRKTLQPILQRLGDEDPRGPRPEELLELKVCDPAMGSGAFLVEACRQLGDTLVQAWHAYDELPATPADEDETILARRVVAQRCLYGVDRNPVAVDLAKVSLWLVTLARDHPFTFLDHALRHGDSLVGLGRRQLEAFHWEDIEANVAGMEVSRALTEVRELRTKIRTSLEDTCDQQLAAWWAQANEALATARFYGDLVVLSFFEGSGVRKRRTIREERALALASGNASRFVDAVTAARRAEPPIVPFHWELEFPEVFERGRPGFDAFIGNPPFMGGRNLSNVAGASYVSWLVFQHEGSGGAADLVAHFFRRGFDLLRENGALGFIATNTIAQGDTRAAGLTWILENGGQIYCARRRVKWPGAAAVIVSVINIWKGPVAPVPELDGKGVDRVTPFLFHSGPTNDPARLPQNVGRSFVGSLILGMGFTFDDFDAKGVATALAEMHRIITGNPDSREVIFPYIGGEELTTHPQHCHHRFVINFGERTADECRSRWPELWRIVEQKVKPERIGKDGDKYPRMVHEWWKFWNARGELQAATASVKRVLAISRVGQHAAFAFLPSDMVFSDALIVFPLETFSAFASLQCRPHELWARFFGSSMKDDPRYTPSDCFETFPFPENWDSRTDLEAVGKEYYEYRANLMIENDEGLTKTYNRFHDPNETDPRIGKLRELHSEMDRAVLSAYGWDDVPTECEFLLDYEIDEEEWGNRRKPYRYRWPDEVHDEVLARLLDLNAQRAAAEASAGAGRAERVASRRNAGSAPDQGRLF